MPTPTTVTLALIHRFGANGTDLLRNAAGEHALNPDGAYELYWPEEFEVVDSMLDAGLLTRKKDEVFITDEGRAAEAGS